MIHRILPRELREDLLRLHVYPNLERTYYWTDVWDPDFYVALARAGFICIAHNEPEYGALLMPEIQESYAVLDWPQLHCSHNLRRLLRSDRLAAAGVELRVVEDCSRVVERLVDYHAPRCWLHEPYRELIGKLPTGVDPYFAILGVELWSRETDQLVAGELGYAIGSTWTSLSGFCTRPDPRWRHFGELQLVLLAELLAERGFAFWNLGHPGLPYKAAMGARTLPRAAFLRRWLKAREVEPPMPVAGGVLQAADSRSARSLPPAALSEESVTGRT